MPPVTRSNGLKDPQMVTHLLLRHLALTHTGNKRCLRSLWVPAKSAAASKDSTTIIDLESGDEGNRNITAPPRPRLIRNNSSSLFSQSQGSFGDDDPDAEFKNW